MFREDEHQFVVEVKRFINALVIVIADFEIFWGVPAADIFALEIGIEAFGEGLVVAGIADEDMNIGDKFRVCIDESIRFYDKLLLVLSEHSLAGNWVAYEVEKARNYSYHLAIRLAI